MGRTVNENYLNSPETNFQSDFYGFGIVQNATKMSSLRNVRIIKKARPVTSDSGIGSEAPSASQSPQVSQDSTQNGNGAKHTEESSEDTNPPAKRPRVLSESENGSEEPVKEPPASSNNGYGFGGMPSPDVVQTRLELLQKSFPNKDRMDLQDALKSCGWSVQTAMEKIRSDAKVINVASQKFGSFQPKRERLRDHEVSGLDMSDSDEEDEYSEKKKVYDSDSEAEEEEIDEKRLPSDKKRVLAFFNDATEPELVAIQGLSKIKVQK